jgi:hypothetical protein
MCLFACPLWVGLGRRVVTTAGAEEKDHDEGGRKPERKSHH